MTRIVVVGAGVAGLTTAVRLADLGHQVTVLEQAPLVGGGLGTLSRDGYTFDTGEPALTLPAVFRDVFRTSGAPLEHSLELVPVEPSWRFQFPDGLVVDLANASRARTTAELDQALGSGAGRQWEAVLRHGQQIWRIIRGPLLDRPLSHRELTRLAVRISAMLTVGAGSSVRTWAQRAVPDPRLRAMLECQAGWTGADPRRAPAALAVLPYLEHAFGTWYVTGGMHRLAVALSERAVLRGATVRTSSEVVDVLATDGRVGGVRLADGEVVPAEAAVVATHAVHLYGDLLPPSPRQRRRLAGATLPSSVFTLLLALAGRTSDMAPRTVLLPEDPDAELDWLAGSAPGPPPEPTAHLWMPDDPSVRPDDGEAWTVHVRAPRHGRAGPGTVDWDAEGVAESFADQLLDMLAARGFAVRDRLRWRVVLTPADRERATRAPGGAVGGFSLTGLRSTWRLPASQSAVDGLYLVGAATHPGSGLAFAGQTGKFAADMIGRAG